MESSHAPQSGLVQIKSDNPQRISSVSLFVSGTSLVTHYESLNYNEFNSNKSDPEFALIFSLIRKKRIANTPHPFEKGVTHRYDFKAVLRIVVEFKRHLVYIAGNNTQNGTRVQILEVCQEHSKCSKVLKLE